MSDETKTGSISTAFDREKNITLNLKRAGKSVVVRFPTDDELSKHSRKIRTFFKKGSAYPEYDGLEEANLELARAIRVSGDEVDESISNRIAELIVKAECGEPERTPDGYRIPIAIVLNAPTAHVLREPTEKEARKYREGSIWMGDMRFGKQEQRMLLSAAGSFYDKLFVSVEGYVGGKESVPVTHKGAAVNAMLLQINREKEEDEKDPADF